MSFARSLCVDERTVAFVNGIQVEKHLDGLSMEVGVQDILDVVFDPRAANVLILIQKHRGPFFNLAMHDRSRNFIR